MKEQGMNRFWTLDLNKLPEEDAAFYRDDEAKAYAWRGGADRVGEYRARYICGEVAIYDCMDERQANTPQALGLWLGVATHIRSAGNQLGEHNRNVESEILRLIKRQRRSLKPGKEPRPIMVLFVTHSSKSRPHDDSCAAWGHQTEKAIQEAERQVRRMNRDYVALDREGKPIRRFVVAFHLHAHTDTEANIWFGKSRRLDPMLYVAGTDGQPRRVALSLEQLGADIAEEFRMTYPYNDSRFSGLSREEYEEIVRQAADMFKSNVNLVRKIAAGQAEASKAGHQGRRILVGRGWEAYDETYEHEAANFTVSDFTKLERDLAIAGKYVLANKIMDAAREGATVCVPYHVNVLYGGWDDLNRQADRCVSTRLAMGLGRDILEQWHATANDASLRAAFRNQVAHAIEHKGGGLRELELLGTVCRDAQTFLGLLRVHVSVSYHDTHALELIATTEDVANS